jgi:thermostable 8-oxoguanine DNA glycosylase
MSISINQIEKLLNDPDKSSWVDFKETEKIKLKLEELQKQRQPFYLTKQEFEEILRWKLRDQYNRQRRNIEKNTEQNIIIITTAAFSIEHADQDYLLELRIKILLSLWGVGVPVASAILALIYPNQYGIIDFRIWRQCFDGSGKQQSFTISQYKMYIDKITNWANELKVPVQAIDLAIWEYDKRNN